LNRYKQSGDVLHDEPNDFGIAGQIGKVREWCDSSPTRSEGDSNSEPAQRLVLGAAGNLDESTFNFEYETPLYPRNTNPDVGFRVARTLGPEEVAILREREAAIAASPK
jgi:formylglycine-generating enzyme required for sulfatase activity